MRTVIASTAGRSAASGRATPAVHALPHAHAVPVPHACAAAERGTARRAGSLPEPDKATLFAVHIFSDKTTEKAQSFYPMVMQNCQLPLDERRKPENCLVIALLPVLKKRECVGALSLRLKRAQSAAFGEAPFRRSVKAHRAVGCRERIDGDHERQYGAAVESNEEAGEAKHKELKDIFRFRTNRRAPEAQIARNLAEKDAFYALRRWP